MNVKSKVLELATAEETVLAGLRERSRVLKARLSAWADALKVVGDDKNAQWLYKNRTAQETTELAETDLKIADAETRIDAWRTSCKFFDRPATSPSNIPLPPGKHDLRPASELAVVRELIRKAGQPLPLSDIVAQLGQVGNEEKYASLRGTLFGYVKKGKVFTLESKSPHVFGLLEFKVKQNFPPAVAA